MNATNPFIEPGFEAGPLFAARQKQDSEPYLTENHRVDDDLNLVGFEPVHDRWMGIGFGRFAQDVGVDQIGHRVSVDSDSMGTK